MARPAVNVSLTSAAIDTPVRALLLDGGGLSPAGSASGVNTSLSSLSSINTLNTLERGGGGGGDGPGTPLPAANRVKVAVRLRPPFEEEGTASALTMLPPAPGAAPLYPGGPVRSKRLQLESEPGKAREFVFDAVFGPGATNTDVYDDVAGPVVDGVLNGINGTVLAYGQTGSGKTFSLGILSRVTGEQGIIPRALSHLFGVVGAARAAAARAPPGGPPPVAHHITMSFLQIYLDGVHDLLSPAGVSLPAALAAGLSSGGARSGGGGGGGSGGGGALPLQGLPVREDPSRGFYVEGLAEFSVNSFPDALALLNWGLENRVLGATRMNATSSRSHTLLSVRVETRAPVALPGGGGGGGEGGPSYGFTTRRSQLLIGDLAGSERVRRTSSRGVRLVEARAINASLHTLGQVIAALSALSSATTAAAAARVHVPWRDSKLTRLLVGNLGGASNTYLLATVGPSPANAGESLSTLLFASRCMRVSASPVPSQPHTQHDFAELAASLQARLDGSDAAHAAELEATRARYEAALRDLSAELEAARRAAEDAAPTLNVSLVAPEGAGGPAGGGGIGGDAPAADGAPALERLYAHLCTVFDEGAAAVWANGARAAEHGRAWARAIAAAQSEGEAEAGGAGSPAPPAAAAGLLRSPLSDTATAELRRVGLLPPLAAPAARGAGGGGGGSGSGGSRPAAHAMQAVHLQHPSNNSFPAGGEGEAGATAWAGNLLAPPAAPGPWPGGGAACAFPHPAFAAFATVDALLAQCARLARAAALNAARLGHLAAAKDSRFDEVKRHLAAAEAALRLRDEDVQSQRYVLRYLVDTTAKLREEVRRAKGKAAAALSGEFEEEGAGEEEGDLEAAAMAGGAALAAAAAAAAAASPPALYAPRPAAPVPHPAPPPAASKGAAIAAAATAAAATATAAASGGRPPRPAAPARKAPTGSPAKQPARSPQQLPTTTVSLLAPSPPAATSAPVGADEEEDAVECIVEQRLLPVGAGSEQQLLYRVRWKGAGPEDDEWFQRADMLNDFPHVVAEFEQRQRGRR
jgi:hypothetical protein